MKKLLLSPLTCFATLFIILSSMVNAQPLSGNYTINSMMVTGGTNFASFNDFASALTANGISADVTATVEPGSGPYPESVIFQNISGLSATAGITIEGNAEIITAVTNSTDRHVVRLTDMSFFTINNLHVAWDPSSTGGFYGIHIFNTGNNITISNCDIDISGTISTLYGSIVASGSETSILTTGDFHNLNIFGNTCTGGGYGVSVFGLVSNLASDIIISSNFIYDFHSNGIYLRETDGAQISDNIFDKRTTQVTGTNAIQIAQNANINANIFNNIINVSQTSNGTMTIRGIYLFNGTGHKVYNNVITDIRLTSGNFTAIEVRTASTSPKIYFNTISLDSPDTTGGNLYGIKEELSSTNSELRNNMISISQPCTNVKSGLVIGTTSSATTAFDTDYNNIYVPGGNVAMKGTTSPTFYPTLLDWQNASTQDANSSDSDPMFTSLSQPIPTNLALDNTGLPLAGYSNDILGNIRSSSPDMGAYEFIANDINSTPSGFVLNVFPNPVLDKLNIEFPNMNEQVNAIKIYRMDGKLVRSHLNSELNGRTQISMDIHNLNDGFYFLKLSTAKETYQSKFVKVSR
ncbi:MAG TPA: T9SS type A sorting domain-containing protein [Bacteroidia bacterium]|nr:T9SS type A sorting domain-containing protein [Bacteroidia bacterium]